MADKPINKLSQPTNVNDFNVLAAAAHDFKSPLALIYGLASEMQYQTDSSQIEQTARDISSASERLMSMIDTVSLAHRVNQMELELQLAPVDMAAAVNQAAYDLSDLAEQFEHPLSIRISRRLPTVMAHNSSVQRIIVSLLDTAIRSAKSNETIQLVARRIGEEVAISITDRTVGIKQREWARMIGNPGSVIHPSPALGSSSGISLYAVKQLATAMNGDFTTQNTAKGSVFLLRLPQVAQMRLF